MRHAEIKNFFQHAVGFGVTTFLFAHIAKNAELATYLMITFALFKEIADISTRGFNIKYLVQFAYSIIGSIVGALFFISIT